MDNIVESTRNAAVERRKQNEVGTREKGKYGDLVMLDADPIADIKNTRKIYKVMKAGEFQ
jgi:imidazolonepropionase-like amidohydrolase